MPGNSETLEILLNILKKGKGGEDAKRELEGVQKAAKAGGAALASFDTSSKAVWRTLTSGARAAGMTASEMGGLATKLGVASDAEVQATIKMNQLTAAWEKGEISSDELASGINELGDQTDDLSDDMGDLSTDVGGLSSVISVAMVAAVAKGAIELAKMSYELAQAGAQSLRTKAAFSAISGSADAAADNLDAMREATRGAMSETDMMAVASQMLQMGLVENAEGLGQMTEMAVRLGSAMGMEAGAAMENWNLMIANQSIPRLDSYGISASKVRTRMAELQAETQGLSRESAFMTAVMEEGATSMERLGPATDDAALSFERAETTAENLKIELSEKLTPAWVAILDVMMLLVTWEDKLGDAQADHAENIMMLGGSYDEYANEVLRAQGQTREGYDLLISERAAVLGVTEAVALLSGEYGIMSEQMYSVITGTSDATGADIALAQSLQRVTEEAGAAGAGIEILADTELNAIEAADRAAASARDLAAAEAEAATQAAIQAGNTADLAESLKDATSGQIASRLIGMLDPEKMGADAYGAAVGQIGLQFGIMDEESIALAENMDELAGAIEDGTIATEDADEALQYLIEDAQDGQVDINNLMTEFGYLANEAESAGGGMERAGRGMERIRDFSGDAAVGIDEVASSAGLAAGSVEALASGLGTTESNLEALVAGSPWTFSLVGERLGGPIKDIKSTKQTGILGGGITSPTDARQYSRTTNQTFIITDPMAAAVALDEQRRLVGHRIERGF